MRVLVCGGRDYEDRHAVYRELDQLASVFSTVTVVEGGARGADQLGREWADERRQKWITEKANWVDYGYAAGPIRNEKMLRDHKPDLVLAFPSPVRGLEGTGTGDMVQRARDAGVEVRVIGLEKKGLFE
jgi:hypothetical protein